MDKRLNCRSGNNDFFDPTTKKFGALGHPITDADTNEPFLVKKGDLLESSIISVRKGEKGSPGELKGIFLNEETPTGNIEKIRKVEFSVKSKILKY